MKAMLMSSVNTFIPLLFDFYHPEFPFLEAVFTRMHSAQGEKEMHSSPLAKVSTGGYHHRDRKLNVT